MLSWRRLRRYQSYYALTPLAVFTDASATGSIGGIFGSTGGSIGGT